MARVIRWLLLLALSFASMPGRTADEGELLLRPQRGQLPAGYPPAYAATVRAAEDEGRLVIYSTTDLDVVAPLLDDFRSMYPRIEVQYEDLNSTVLHHRFIAETKLGPDSSDETEATSGSADVLWSSAMDQQAALVAGGYARAYESPEGANVPAWAQWRGQAYATTAEPIVMVYNHTLLPTAAVPQSRADLVRLLDSDAGRFRGKVVSYDIEKSGVGFFLATQDASASPGWRDVTRALHRAGVRGELTTVAMINRVASGQAVLAYNALGPYALAQARKNPALGIVFPKDYTLVASRIVLISRRAAHPNAARLWVDYVLSRRGQTVIARSGLFAVRGDVDAETTVTRLAQTLGASNRPITIGPGLTGYRNEQDYVDFIREWRRAETAP